jgi:hypothetical protein
MRYEMKNFIKFAKSKVGPKPSKKDDWKRERSVARATKRKLQNNRVA